jgi:hypothetical protein
VTLERVRRMPLDELLCRGRQEAWKRLERTWRLPRAPRVDPRAASCIRERAGARFFAGASHPLTPQLLSERMPEARTALQAEADRLLEARFDLLGYRSLSFGSPIDWQFDPVSDRRPPRVHWSRLNPLDFSQVGDSKVVWELNRHQWMVRLAQAARVTGGEQYAQAMADHVRRWIDANPPGIGINWASSLEVSFRLIAWCWCLVLLEGSRALSPDFLETLVGQIRLHARHVARYLSYYFSPNTHLTGEALGLYYAGQMLRELPESARWRDLGERILIEECERQILSDGVYVERATGYQRYTLEFYLHYLILAARSGRPAPAVVAERTEKMLDVVLALGLPDRSVPQIGDADSGSLVPLAPRAQTDFRGVMALAAVVFTRSDCAWAAGGPAPELLWLLGPDALQAFDALVPAPPSGLPSRLFSEGGYAVMRNGWRADGQALTFDVGPLGGAGSAGHGHADLLSVQCAAFGEALLVDAGTFCYTGDDRAREFFRGSDAHSTITVDGQPQARPIGPFRWDAHPAVRLGDWRTTPTLDFADAAYEGGDRVPGFERHRRRVLYVKDSYWVIVDDLEGAGEHQVDLRFQCAPVDVRLTSGTCASITGRSGHGLLVQPFAACRIVARVRCGELQPMQGWISSEYGERHPAPVVQYTARASFPFRIVTLLAPVRQGEPAPAASVLAGSRHEPVGLVFDETGEQVRFGDGGMPLLERTTPVPATV